MRKTPRHAPNVDVASVVRRLPADRRASPISEIAGRLGRPPSYAYDRRLMSERIASRLRPGVPPSLIISFCIQRRTRCPAVVQPHGRRGRAAWTWRSAVEKKKRCCASAGLREWRRSASVSPGRGMMDWGARAKRSALARRSTSNPRRRWSARARIGRSATGFPARGSRGPRETRVRAQGLRREVGGGGREALRRSTWERGCPPCCPASGNWASIAYGFHIYSGSQSLTAETSFRSTEQDDRARHPPSQQSASDLAFPVLEPSVAASASLWVCSRATSISKPRANRGEPRPDGWRMLRRAPSRETARPPSSLGRYSVGEAGLLCVRGRRPARSRAGEVFPRHQTAACHQQLGGRAETSDRCLRKNFPWSVANKFHGSVREHAHGRSGRYARARFDILAARIGARRGPAPADLERRYYQSGAYGYTTSPDRLPPRPSHTPAQVLV
jgi:diaminopimelate decarboxylase